MCLVTASVSMACSFISCVNVFHIVSPISYILNLYLLVFGAVCVILEYGAGSFDRLGVIPLVHRYTSGLTTVAGRGMFYFFQGTLTLSDMGLLNILNGCTLCVAGLLCGAHAYSLTDRVIGYTRQVDATHAVTTLDTQQA